MRPLSNGSKAGRSNSDNQRKRNPRNFNRTRNKNQSKKKKKERLKMAENNPKHDLNAKWDACLDLTVRRFVYSSLAGAFSGLLFFRSPVTRWASVAFGAGLGIGSAYTDCNSLFDESTRKLASPKITESQPSQEG